MVKIDKIFDVFSKKTLFKNKSTLQSNYYPEQILYRDKQIEQIASILAPCLRMERPSNIFIYGKTGTGKSLSILYIAKKLRERAKKQKANVKIIYINCKLKKVADTEYRILVELIKKLGDDSIPKTGLSVNFLYEKFVDLINKEKQVLILILDEIDQAVKKIGDEFLYNLTRINTELKNAQVVIVGVSNDIMFIRDVDPRVRSSLGEEEVSFPPYNALQLKDILEQRAKKAFNKNILEEGVISKCSAYAAREHGDARRALDLLRIAGELAERQRKDKITLDYINKAQEKIEKDMVLDIVQTQPKQFQLVLMAILELEKQNKKNNKIFTGDVYNLYKELCKSFRIDCLTQRRVSDILAEFDMYGIINAIVVSKGRHGRTREINSAIPPSLKEKVRGILKESLNL